LTWLNVTVLRRSYFDLLGRQAKAEEISMNEHLSGAERRSEPSPGETPEFDAMTWGAEQPLKAMIE